MINQTLCCIVVSVGLLGTTLSEVTAQNEVGERFRDCRSPICPEMVVVPAGSFVMGVASEHYEWASPEHSVTIEMPFAVGVYEVTFAEWDACVDAGGCGDYRPGDRWGRENRPVVLVSWEEAQGYVAWLSKTTGENYRLPSEAEWEYAARAGTRGFVPWDIDDLCEYTEYMNSDVACEDGYGLDDGFLVTAPVGSFKPNGFGLYDVIGNVGEWTEDCWHDDYVGAPTDGSAWVSGDCLEKYRIIRGCHAGCTAGGRGGVAARRRQWPSVSDEPHPTYNTARAGLTGFRVVRDIAPEALTDDSRGDGVLGLVARGNHMSELRVGLAALVGASKACDRAATLLGISWQ